MYVFTFYSFKGGVGRTMALVNVAAELARRGRKVLVVDFDLEAPGLETYKHLRPGKPHPGVVEYVTEFRRNYEVPDVRDYIYETKPIGKKGGKLWVMPAGRRDRAYRMALANLDWQRLYKDEHGFLLFEDTKLGWEKEYKPDYVFIDSRTGDTDVLGICTRQLPDSVVLMFTPNEQNLAGLESVCRDIRREETEGLKKKIKLHFVAANVPVLDDERGILRRQLKAFKSRLDFREFSGVIHRYDNLNLLEQSVFTLDRPHSKLARSYRKLIRVLLKDNIADRDGAILFLKDYPSWMERRLIGIEGKVHGTFHREDGTVSVWVGNSGDVSAEGKEALLEIARRFENDADLLRMVADCFVREEEFKRAIAVMDRISQLDPADSETLFRRAECKTHCGMIDDAANDYLDCLTISSRIKSPGLAELGRDFEGRALMEECISRFCRLAPCRMERLGQVLQATGFPGRETEIFTEVLSEFEEAIPIAAKLIKKYCATLDVSGLDEAFRIGLARTLIKARCWNEAITILTHEAFERLKAETLALLVLARWGKTGQIPEFLCQEALGVAREPESLADAQHLAWLTWGMGQANEALEYLEAIEQAAHSHSDEIFSLWRFREVSVEQFIDDCKLVRRMFQGEPLRPAFLGPLSAGHADVNGPRQG